MKPKVVLIGTGGTIASRYDVALGRKVAGVSSSELVAMLPGVGAVADLEVDNFLTISSFQMDAGTVLKLTRRIGETLRRPDVAGVAVTHGTDTMEESAYLADILVDSEKPVIFTGAQRSADEPDGDGRRNLMGAIRAAASPASAGLGAMICFNDELHAARDVTKTHTSAVQTFQSYDHGKLGLIDGDRVVIDRRPQRRPRYVVERLEERVDLVKLVLGLDARPIDGALAAGAKAIVLEAFGLGNTTSEVADGVRRSIDAGVPVIVTSRCPIGQVRPVYGGGGGGRDLEDMGAIYAGDLAGVKARMLLMVLLADGPSMAELGRRIAAAIG
jgi:L-asparaginase